MEAKRLQKLKYEVETYGDQLIAESRHQEWLKEQNRLLERKKVEKQLAAQGISFVGIGGAKQQMQSVPKIEHKLIPLPDDGFVVFYDFIIGFNADLKQCRLSTSLMVGVELQQDTVHNTEWESIYDHGHSGKCIAMLQSPNVISDASPSSDCKLAVSVQTKNAADSEAQYGWTILMPLFLFSNVDDQGWLIPKGSHKVQLSAPPIMVGATLETLPQITKCGATLYFRIAPISERHLLIDPNVDELNLYKMYRPRLPSVLPTPRQLSSATTKVIEEESKEKEAERSRMSTGASLVRSDKPSAMSRAESVTMSQQLYDTESGVGVLVCDICHGAS